MKANSPELELKAISAICRSKESIGLLLLSSLDQEDFKYSVTKAAFKRLRFLYKSKGLIVSAVDLINDPSVKDDHRKVLKGTRIRISSPDRAQHLVDKLKEYTSARSTIEITDRAIKSITENDTPDVYATIDTLTKDITRLRMGGGLSKRFEVVDYGVSNSMKALLVNKIKGDGKRLVRTGFKQFDRTNGGLVEDALFLLGGDTGLGKTTIAQQMAVNMSAMGERVGFVSLEMGADEMHELVMANISGVSASTITKHDPKQRRGASSNIVLSNDQINTLRDAEHSYIKRLKSTGGSLHFIVPQEEAMLEEIFMAAAPHGFSVLFIDYVSLLKGTGGDKQWQLLTDVTKAAKWYARKNNCIVVLLMQTKDGEAKLSQGMVYDANNAWFFTRELDGDGEPIMKAIQPKARKAKQYDMYFKEDFDHARITELFNYAQEDAGPEKVKTRSVSGDSSSSGGQSFKKTNAKRREGSEGEERESHRSKRSDRDDRQVKSRISRKENY